MEPSNLPQVTVFIVDDDAAMLDSTSELLTTAGLPSAAYNSAESFLASGRQWEPGCLLLDLTMPVMNGIQLIARLRHDAALLPVVIVTGEGTIQQAVDGMKLGAVDVLLKPVPPAMLLQKVQTALDMDLRRRHASDEAAEARRRTSVLTHRERELVQLLVRGQSSKQAASAMGISVRTAENHRINMMKKVGAVNIADLTRLVLLAERT